MLQFLHSEHYYGKRYKQDSMDIYLLMVLRRPDIMPSADLALLMAAQKIKRLASRPTPDELNTLSKNWKPWRSVAARLLWHYYLNGR